MINYTISNVLKKYIYLYLETNYLFLCLINYMFNLVEVHRKISIKFKK